jgi:hypothetical protein
MAKKEAKLKPGRYFVEVTIHKYFTVDHDDSYDNEDDLLGECRRNGEMVDWEVNRDGD